MSHQTKPSPLRSALAQLHWTQHSWLLMSGFILIIGLIMIVWMPLVADYLTYIDWTGPWYHYIDWLLIGVFLVMSFLVMARADLRTDFKIIFVGVLGGLVIESWGTQTLLWTYYTNERPPLWIIPAWPIASLAIDRITRFLNHLLPGRAANTYRATGSGNVINGRWTNIAYWSIFAAFYALMLYFVFPTFDKSFTWMALGLCALLIVTPHDRRWAVLTFAAGSGLGYFLERWGTTRECWTYYTLQTPPVFAVFAHGMAAVAFWRAQVVLEKFMAVPLQRLRDFARV